MGVKFPCWLSLTFSRAVTQTPISLPFSLCRSMLRFITCLFLPRPLKTSFGPLRSDPSDAMLGKTKSWDLVFLTSFKSQTI